MTNRIHIEERGKGRPIALLHGTPTAPAHMRPLAEQLARDHRTLLVHNPGAGESAPLDPYDLEASHVLVANALRAHGVERAIFIGMSGGSFRASAIVATGLVAADAFAFLAPALTFSPETSGRLRDAAAALRAGVDLSQAVLDLMLSASGRTDATAVADIASWLPAYASRGALADELDAFAREDRDLAPFTASLAVPVLLRSGRLDLSTPPADTLALANKLPTAIVELVEGKGHALLAEDFEATAASVEGFVGSV